MHIKIQLRQESSSNSEDKKDSEESYLGTIKHLSQKFSAIIVNNLNN